MATYTARIDSSTPASPVVITSVPSGWIDSMDLVGTSIGVNFTALGLTNPVMILAQSEEDPIVASWINNEPTTGATNIRAEIAFINLTNDVGTVPTSFAIVIETQD